MAVPPSDPLSRIEGIQAINGPASVNAILVDSVTTANFEGIWFPWQFVKQGSLEVSGVMTTLSCQLYGTNLINPLNAYVATVAGTVGAGHTISLAFQFPQQLVTVSYGPTTGGDTATTIAAGLVAAIAANTTLVQQYGVTASNVAGAITVNWPSNSPGAYGANTFQSTSSPIIAPNLFLTGSSTGAETVTVVPGSSGSALGTAITALGMTQFTFSARWLKLRLTTLTGGGAVITAVAQGTA